MYATYGEAPILDPRKMRFSVCAKGSDYLFTNSLREATWHDLLMAMNLKAGCFSLIKNSAAGAVALKRCQIKSTGGHFLSTVSNCEGQIVEQTLGYVYQQA